MEDRRTKFLLAEMLIIFIFSLAFISAVPPITTIQQFTEGYTVQIPQDNILKVGQDYNFEFHVFNISNGVPKISGISCDFHLFDSFGNHKFTGTDSTVDIYRDYSFNLTRGNFSSAENIYYFIRCNSSSLGGFAESILYITDSGINSNSFNSFNIWGLFGIAVLLFIIGLTFKPEQWKVKTFFFITSLLMGIIFLNTIRLVIGSSSELVSMGNIGLILGIIVLSFMLLYMLINYTIEVFHYFKEKGRMKWSVEQG